MKVGFVIDDSLDRNDGVQQYVRSLGGWLSLQGHIVHYLAGQSQEIDKTVHSLSRNITVRFNGNRLTIPLPANGRDIRRLLKDESYDVLHVQMPYSPMMASKVIRNASGGTAIVGTFHILPLGRLQRHGSRALAMVQKHEINRFDAICSVSSAAKEFAGAYFGISSSVIPNMINTSAWETVVRPHPYRIVFLGRLVPRKGCKQLLAAIAELPDSLLDRLEVFIAGDGAERQKLEKFASKLGLNGVRFLGFVEEKDKPGLLASAELAIFPSLGGESFGIVLIEAMAAGAGVVLGGNNPGYRSVLSNWPEVLVEPKDRLSFSDSLERLLKDKTLRTKLHGLQQKALKKYDVDTVGPQIIKLYKDALLHRHEKVR